MKPNIFQHPLSYIECLETRNTPDVQLVVIHCTELPDLASARQWGEKIIYPDSATGNSGHYYIDRDGCIEQWVPLDRIAHHVRGHNQYSIGIELVNTGRYPDWFDTRHQQMSEPYPAAQLHALTGLLALLAQSLPGLKYIAGHDELDTDMTSSSDVAGIMVRRKLDPGPMFPWQEILGKTRLVRMMVE